MSPRFWHGPHGLRRSHLSLRCRHAAQLRGTRLRLRMTLKEPLSGDAPLVEEWEEGGVGLLEEAGIMARRWQVAGVQD